MSQIPDDIQAQLNGISNSTANIKKSILAKGITPSGGLSSYASAIDGITGSRNIGEIVASTIPLVDAGLHLLDGSLVTSGSYAGFVDYIADLYDSADKYNNLEITGGVIDTDGVLSNFSSTAYAILPLPFAPSTNSWEVVFNITTGDSTTTRQFIVSAAYPIGCGAFDILIQNGKFAINISSVGNTWDIASEVAGSYSVLTETEYYVKLAFDGTDYTLSYSLDGETYTTDITVTSSSTAYQLSTLMLGLDYTGSAFADPFLGTIDLNNSYINIGSTRSWSGRLPACFTDEGQWQQTVTTYSVCGKFVYDPVNNTVRLPKVTGFVEGTTTITNIGDLVEAGLPNITGTVHSDYPGNFQGAFYIYRDAVTGNGGSGTDCVAGFDASRSSSIYGNSSTVQPQAIKVLYYVVIATSTKTTIEVDIDEVATDLNGKADTDLTNVENIGKSKMAHSAMPSSTYDEWVVGASGSTYTAPADGWVIAQGACTASSGWANLYTSENVNTSYTMYGANIGYKIFVPVSKGSTVLLGYSNVSISVFYFVYANGSAHEAL